MKKLAIYQKGNAKPVIISDSDNSSLDDTVKMCEEIFKSDKIYKIQTKSDCFIGKPSELQSILISSEVEELKNDKTGKKYEDSVKGAASK